MRFVAECVAVLLILLIVTFFAYHFFDVLLLWSQVLGGSR